MSWRELIYVYLAVLSSLLLQQSSLYAQNEWASTYFVSNERAFVFAVRQTSDDGFVLTGSLTSADFHDLWVLKLDSFGAIQWQKTYGGDLDDVGFWIEQTNDGGYIVAGQTFSFGAGSNDVWVLKLDQAGNLQWQKTLGGSRTDFAFSIKQTPDSGFIVAASTSPSLPIPGLDFLLVKLDSSGNIVWQKSYGGLTEDVAYSVSLTSDDGFIVSGTTDSFGAGFNDFWLLKLDSAGGIQWQKTYGGPDTDEGFVRGAQETFDGGFIMAGTTGTLTDPAGDIVVLKLDSAGQVQWQKSYGGTASEFATSIQQTTNGGYIVGGETESISSGAFWLLRLDAVGDIEWQKAYDENDSEVAYSLHQTSDGGFVVAGSDRDRIGLSGAWILKVDENGEIDPSCPFVIDTDTVPATVAFTELSSAATVFDTSLSISSTTAIANKAFATSAQQCVNTCLFCDTFGDGILASDWKYLSTGWSETGGDLIGSALQKKAVAIARPAFSGCDICSIRATLESAGGPRNKVSLLTHYLDKRTHVEVILNEEADKVVVRQRLNGNTVAKAKSSITIDPNTRYDVLLFYDGSLLIITIDGVPIITLTSVGSLPSATVGFKVKNTTASFGEIRID